MYLIEVMKEMNVLPDKLTVAKMLPVVKSKCPGFFTPLKDLNDAGKALISPITDPLILGVVSAVLLGESALTVVNSLRLIVKAEWALYNSEYHEYRTLAQAAKEQVAHAVELTFSAIGFALLSILATPVLALHALTRAVSTIAPLIASGFMALVDDCSVPHRTDGEVPLDATRYV